MGCSREDVIEIKAHTIQFCGFHQIVDRGHGNTENALHLLISSRQKISNAGVVALGFITETSPQFWKSRLEQLFNFGFSNSFPGCFENLGLISSRVQVMGLVCPGMDNLFKQSILFFCPRTQHDSVLDYSTQLVVTGFFELRPCDENLELLYSFDFVAPAKQICGLVGHRGFSPRHTNQPVCPSR